MKWGAGVRAASTTCRRLRPASASVGEPINPEAWIWLTREHIGSDRTPIRPTTWWQTETGMVLITPLPGVTTTKPGRGDESRFPGIDCRSLRRARQRGRPPGGGGYLVLKRPWPAMLRGIFGDDRALPRDLLVEVREMFLFRG